MDADSSSSAPPLRLVIFPWLGFGHLLPYLELTDRLASRGHHISFVSTPRNIARLPALRPAAAPHVDLVALPLPPVDGLPDGAESTNDIPSDKFELLRKAFDGLAMPFAEFMGAACADQGKRPDWVIVDSFHHWATLAALNHKVPCAVLLPTAAMLAASGRPVAMPRYEWEQLSRFFMRRGESGMSNMERCELTAERSTIGAIRSCPEWEPECFSVAAKTFGKPVIPIGLLPPSSDGGRATNKTDDDATVRWLDAQPPNSVLYVALGSEVPLGLGKVHELAHGLELAGTRFLWALRKPHGISDDNLLPTGFRDRTHGHGMVATGWVPQMSILAHGSVGGFLTHCGRNSLIEGLLFGNPLVMLPIYGDQGPNARNMEKRIVGVQVNRDENDGSFDREGVAAAVRAVMVQEETRSVFVENARKMQKTVVGNKELQERYMDEFIQYLRSYISPGGSVTTTSTEDT